MRSDGPHNPTTIYREALGRLPCRLGAHATGVFCHQQPGTNSRRYRVIVYCVLTFFIFFLDRRASRVRLVLAKERILECRVSLMCYVQNLSELGFAVRIIQQWVFFNIGIAEETGFNAHSQHM